MPWRNILNLILAILSFASIVGVGVGVADQSALEVVLAIVGIFVFMGAGFTLKRKYRESNQG